jgi:hypothetical protein
MTNYCLSWSVVNTEQLLPTYFPSYEMGTLVNDSAEVFNNSLVQIATEVEQFLIIFKAQVVAEVRQERTDNNSVANTRILAQRSMSVQWEIIKTIVNLLADHLSRHVSTVTSIRECLRAVDSILHSIIQQKSPFRFHEYQLPFQSLKLVNELRKSVRAEASVQNTHAHQISSKENNATELMSIRERTILFEQKAAEQARIAALSTQATKPVRTPETKAAAYGNFHVYRRKDQGDGSSSQGPAKLPMFSKSDDSLSGVSNIAPSSDDEEEEEVNVPQAYKLEESLRSQAKYGSDTDLGSNHSLGSASAINIIGNSSAKLFNDSETELVTAFSHPGYRISSENVSRGLQQKVSSTGSLNGSKHEIGFTFFLPPTEVRKVSVMEGIEQYVSISKKSESASSLRSDREALSGLGKPSLSATDLVKKAYKSASGKSSSLSLSSLPQLPTASLYTERKHEMEVNVKSILFSLTLRCSIVSCRT